MVRGIGLVALGMVALLVLLIIGAAQDDDGGPELSGVNAEVLPELARSMLPVINDVLDHQCPELPAVWVVAEVMAESSWNPHAWSNDSNGGAAGLYQINQSNWMAAGGQAWGGSPPPPGADIYQPETQLRVGIPWVCANLRAVTGHLRDTGKATSPLDAMLVCHIAGCGRVTGSATGIPAPGEAGCGGGCVSLIHRYLNNIHRFVEKFSAPPPVPAPDVVPRIEPDARAASVGSGLAMETLGGVTTAALPAAPMTFAGPAGGGCTQQDPTSRGCLTPAARWALDQQVAAFGAVQHGPTLASAGCWDAHAWNPGSDHAKGRACDLFPGTSGQFAAGTELARGWRVANWFRRYAGQLHVAYVIWQGRYWQPGDADQGGWGERYDGGGIYNVKDATGGHYDHVHVSFAQ
ncbi:transglycosylase SLT domain-containing protein [Pseudonocardia spinosispora]|uniref:transglycosylase SLT domain-containing protein n=1 Tax=Pseudonocardia spinosispora TaxID=103441 RepID=UPI0004119669|nr:transglycosylase SLT domain-containing protein [Pseudonocardia spinosispora]